MLDLLGDFLPDFLADFFVDLLDFFDLLEDLERADVLAMDHLSERVVDNLARSLTAVSKAELLSITHQDGGIRDWVRAVLPASRPPLLAFR